MKYFVRMPGQPDKELVFSSMRELEQAWLHGLVDAEDEVREDGGTAWRKAGALPVLRAARRSPDQAWGGSQLGWMMLGISLGSLSLWMIQRGVQQQNPGYWVSGLLLGMGVGALLTRVTMNAFKRSRPGGG
ncbi:MAG: hypothetical protein FJ086_04765 [Deltaproteobacteria bacterium]|nr:hypothetical protein [Deltaproteobacteria bacterium]